MTWRAIIFNWKDYQKQSVKGIKGGEEGEHIYMYFTSAKQGVNFLYIQVEHD